MFGSLFFACLDWFVLKIVFLNFLQPKIQWGSIVKSRSRSLVRSYFLVTRVNLRELAISLFGFDSLTSSPVTATHAGKVKLVDVPLGDQFHFSTHDFVQFFVLFVHLTRFLGCDLSQSKSCSIESHVILIA